MKPDSDQVSITTEVRVMVDMTASLLHHGHIRLLQKAKSLGHVVVALATDEEVEKHKGYKPELCFDERKEILLALRYVDEVIAAPWLIQENFVRSHQADILLHGDDNSNLVNQIKTFPRTVGISSDDIRHRAITSLTVQANSRKPLFTPGPCNLHPESIDAIRPLFTRDDSYYNDVSTHVLERIKALSGQDRIVAMQGSATTAIEVATTNFLKGRVLVIDSGYYSARIVHMLERKEEQLKLEKLVRMTYTEFEKQKDDISGFDWIVAVSTETADAFLADVPMIKLVANRMKASLMIDATGSINLDQHHELADACMFSSCKGLGGLTGAGFITFNETLLNRINPCQKDFILDINTFIEKKTTSPAHALCSLFPLADKFHELGGRVRQSKEIFMDRFASKIYRTGYQPALCTKVRAEHLDMPTGSISYSPRSGEPGTHVICHLFDQFPSNKKIGDTYSGITME